jgi:hypothetical protein
MATRITIERALLERARLGSELRSMGNLPDALSKSTSLPGELQTRVLALLERATENAQRYTELCQAIAESNRVTSIELSFHVE